MVRVSLASFFDFLRDVARAAGHVLVPFRSSIVCCAQASHVEAESAGQASRDMEADLARRFHPAAVQLPYPAILSILFIQSTALVYSNAQTNRRVFQN